MYASFCSVRTEKDVGDAAFVGANGWKAWLIANMFLNGVKRSMNTMPMLNICTPPPDMYNMKPCIGRDLTGAAAKSQARFSFSWSYASGVSVEVVPRCDLLVWDFEKPGGGGNDLYFELDSREA